MGVGGGGDDREAEPAAAVAARAGGVGAVEAVEYVGEPVRRNARPRVADLDLDHVRAVRAGRDVQLVIVTALIAHGMHGIDHQVEQNLLELCGVYQN